MHEVSNAFVYLVFKLSQLRGDYHVDVNAKICENCLKTKLIPNSDSGNSDEESNFSDIVDDPNDNLVELNHCLNAYKSQPIFLFIVKHFKTVFNLSV